MADSPKSLDLRPDEHLADHPADHLTDQLDRDARLAAELVRDAGQLALRMMAAGLTVSTKTDVSDLVSDADKAAEAMVVERLGAERPADGIIGEEGAAAPGERTWVIDPVDGTYNFVSGLPAWCSALALTGTSGRPADVDPATADRMMDEALLLGAVYQATTDELWLGGPERGTTCNGLPVAPIPDAPLEALSVVTWLHPGRLSDATLREPILGAVAGAASLRVLGSGSVELAGVAAGRLGVWLHADTLIWDWLPGAALVRGAGGVTDVVEHLGHRFFIAGPPTAVAQVRDAVLAVRV
ncbi:inositol monophosphatase family protein [Nakamurella leprariae]|uniref:inositol monophosphatase family protein n=1 Tax=Nakamurella leprariae TaxID=2803911 RepID=UPI002E2935BA|nr:inositol monophosphatase family protein [Nakamurella leprariae]